MKALGNYWSIIIVWLAVIVLLSGCGNKDSEGEVETTKSQSQFNDFGGAFVIDTLPPAEITDEIINAVVDEVNMEMGLKRIQGFGAKTTVDFLRIKGRWFAALIMRRDDSQGLGRCIIGKTYSKYVQYAYLPDIVLSRSDMEEYLRITNRDSAWTYFDDYGFWTDERNWIRLFEEESNITRGLILFSRMKSNTSSSDPPGPMLDAIWTFDLSQIASKELREWAATAVPHLPHFTGVDYLAKDSNWFAAIIVHRVTERVVYSPIVGEHFDDSLLYRHLYGEPMVLEGDSVAEYMNSYRSNNLWTLINNGDWESDAAGIRQLWRQAGEGKDSTAITRKVTLPLNKPTDH